MSTNGAVLTTEMLRCVGMESTPMVTEVEKGAILKFAEAIGDPNPLWQDEARARRSRYGGIIAPPTFLRSVRISPLNLPFTLPPRRLDGGMVWNYFAPVRAGDRLTSVQRLKDLFEKDGRLGTMVFVVYENRYANQLGELVATQQSTIINY